MVKSFGSFSAIIAVSLVAACGGGDDDTSDIPAEPISGSSAVAAANTTSRLVASLYSGDGPAVAAGVYSLGSVASTMVQARPVAARLLPPVHGDLLGTCACTRDAGCTFVDCRDEDETFRVNGSVSIDGDDHIGIDVQASFSVGDRTWSWDYNGDLLAGAFMLDGLVSGLGHSEADDKYYDWFWALDLSQVQFDESGCGPNAGRASALVDFTVSSAGKSDEFAGEGGVIFGPECGQAVVDADFEPITL